MKSVAAAIAFAAALCTSPDLKAQQRQSFDPGSAQGAMYKRIMEEVDRYAEQIQMQGHFVSYCWQELHLKTYAHPINGHEPFGVDYNRISSKQQLDRVIAIRENYEKVFLMLCLANAKKHPQRGPPVKASLQV